jgi:hypothetical protein
MRTKLALAASLAFAVAAQAAIVPISAPDASYQSSTTLLPVTGDDFSTVNSLSDANLTVSFSNVMTIFTSPGTWTAWSAPPNSETATPRVLAPDLNVFTITLTFSQGLSIFGLEAQPDAIIDYGNFPLSLQYYNNATLLGSVDKVLNGETSSLFAASSGTPITSVVLTVGASSGGTKPGLPGADPGIAQLRYALAGREVVTPEPATMLTCGGMLVLLAGLRRLRSRS